MRQVNPHWTKSKSIAISHALNYRLASFESMRRHGAKNADYRGGVTCLYDTQLLGACLHASECGGRSRPEAVRGMPDVPIAPPATGPNTVRLKICTAGLSVSIIEQVCCQSGQRIATSIGSRGEQYEWNYGRFGRTDAKNHYSRAQQNTATGSRAN